MNKIAVSQSLSFPLDVITQTVGILAKRRSGKSYAMRLLAEQLFAAKQQIVIVDPKGDQWGIRSAADGQSPGLPIVILGGERGDVPLESNGGDVVAKLVVEDRVSVLLDLSLFRKHEVATFMTGFLENLYRLKAREAYRTAMMLIVDEADAIAPQRPMKGEERMLGAAEDIVRRGGQRGIGCTLVTQRSAVINKNVLTQIQILICLRTIAPQDLAAIDAWIDVHGTEDERKTLKASLPSLPVGDAWVWSPGWPSADGIFERVHVSPIKTFDSGATPKPGERREDPKNLADIDLNALSTKMAATIERSKANDPKELRHQIAALRKQLDAKVPAKTETVEKFVLANGELERAEELADSIKGLVEELSGVESQIRASLAKVSTNGHPPKSKLRRSRLKLKPEDQWPKPTPQKSDASRKSDEQRGWNYALSGPQQRIVDALGWIESVGQTVASKPQIALLSNQSPTSGSYFNNLGALRTAGLIDYPNPGSVALTASGRERAGISNVPTDMEDFHNQVCDKLSGPQTLILRELIEMHPDSCKKDELAERVGQSPTSGSYYNNLGRLRTLKLIDYPQAGYAAATDLLFPEGLS